MNTQARMVEPITNVVGGVVQWVVSPVPYIFLHLCVQFCRRLVAEISEPFEHWSRKYEYCWVHEYGKFAPGEKVLDAGGGATPLCYILAGEGVEVTNYDLKTDHLLPYPPHLTIINGDIAAMPFADGHFDRAYCISVLEHGEDPERMLDELWRVLKPGGRLLVTFDVASPALPDSPFDLERARELVARFGLRVPDHNGQAIINIDCFPGHELRALCFFADKLP